MTEGAIRKDKRVRKGGWGQEGRMGPGREDEEGIKRSTERLLCVCCVPARVAAVPAPRKPLGVPTLTRGVGTQQPQSDPASLISPEEHIETSPGEDCAERPGSEPLTG